MEFRYIQLQALLLGVFLQFASASWEEEAAEQHGVYYPTDCEACKYLAVELESRLKETGKSHEVLETGYDSMNSDKVKRKKYEKSELRLIESLQGICENILEYNIHKERKDSTRFAKGMSETFRTLHGLVDKGVKVDLGIPYDLWDKPSVEVVTLKTKCETLVEKHEDDIEEWYFNYQGKIPLDQYLCSQRALKKGDDGCLVENEVKKKPATSEGESPSKANKKSKSRQENEKTEL